MKDEKKTKAQLIEELNELRQRVGELEAVKEENQPAEESESIDEVRFRVSLSDITARKQEEEATQVNLALQRVRNEVLQMDTEESWDRVILSFHEELKGLVDFNACSINLVDLLENRMTAHAVNPEKGGLVRNFREPVPPAVAKALESGQYEYRRTRRDPLFVDPVSTMPGVHSIIDVPFVGGTLAVNSTQENAFSERDIHVLEQFSQVMSEAHRRLQDVTERKRRETEQTALNRIRDVMWKMKNPDDINKLMLTIRNELEVLEVPFQGCSVNIIEDLEEPVITSHQLSPDSVWTKRGPGGSAEFLKQIWTQGVPFYRRDLNVDDPSQEEALFYDNYRYSVRSVIDVPFSQGTFALNSFQANAFSEEHIEFLKTIVGVLSEGFRRVQDLQHLAESEERYRRVVESSLAGIVTVDPEENLTFVNQAFADMVGYSVGELTGMNFAQFVSPEEIERYQQGIEQRREGIEAIYESTIHRKDGTLREIMVAVSPLFSNEGQFEGTMAVIEEITARKQAEEALVQEYRLREVDNAIRVAIASMIDPEDLKGVLDEVSSRLTQLGVTHDAISLQIMNPEGTEFFTLHSHAGEYSHWDYFLDWWQAPPPPLSTELSEGQLKEVASVIEVWKSGRFRYEGCAPRGLGVISGRCVADVAFSHGTLAISSAQPHAFGKKDLVHLQRFAAIITDGFQRFVDITERQRAQEALQTSHDELEQRVEERTAELQATNVQLQQEITEHQETEKILRESEERNRTLVKESHHRIKNNLQIISSLLELQAHQIEEETVLAVLQDSSYRVRAISLIHERLYQSTDLTQIDLGDYLRTLTEDLMGSSSGEMGVVSVEFQLEEVTLGMDAAVSCGLIVNELVTNAIQHAFPVDQKGTIGIGLQTDRDTQITLTVWDDGRGIPPGMDFLRSESLGLKLVMSLVRQLRGKVEIDRNDGTRFEIFFSQKA